ncbi:MAG: Ig-like domain-containing protein, partial [Pseudohongiella sp.]|nr:Ig-like domain-containing protein [Pseudohongiella sp.]
MSKAQTNSNSGSKGNSGNTNGGTQTSFTNTPQAKDDTFGTPQSGQLNYANNTYLLNVMANDLGGNSKSLWSVDNGINNSGAMNGYVAGDLLTQDQAGITGLAENRSLFGASLTVTPDGRVAYDASTISGQTAADLTGLKLGDVMTDSFIYAIRMANGTLSWAKASVVLTGVNDTPTVTGVSLAAIEDNGAVTGSFAGDDVDSDDNISTLIYTIVGAPNAGTLVNNGNGTFTFDPGAAFQSLAKGEQAHFNLSYTATDRHGAVSAPASLTI